MKSQTVKISKICDDSMKELEHDSLRNEALNTVTYNILDLTVKIFSNVMMEIFLGGTEN